MKHLAEHGRTHCEKLYEVSGSTAHPGHFLDRLIEAGLINEKAEGVYDLNYSKWRDKFLNTKDIITEIRNYIINEISS